MGQITGVEEEGKRAAGGFCNCAGNSGELEYDLQTQLQFKPVDGQISHRSILSSREVGDDCGGGGYIARCSNREINLDVDEMESNRNIQDAPLSVEQINSSFIKSSIKEETTELLLNTFSSGIAVSARQLDSAINSLLEVHTRQLDIDSAQDDQVDQLDEIDVELENMFLEEIHSARSNVHRVIQQ